MRIFIRPLFLHPMIGHITIKVSGKVQGVFFRASTKEEADRLNIKGSVRNEQDGSVWIEAEGDSEALQTFIGWCKHGPRMARVDYCEVTKQASLKNFKQFEISRVVN